MKKQLFLYAIGLIGVVIMTAPSPTSANSRGAKRAAGSPHPTHQVQQQPGLQHDASLTACAQYR